MNSPQIINPSLNNSDDDIQINGRVDQELLNKLIFNERLEQMLNLKVIEECEESGESGESDDGID